MLKYFANPSWDDAAADTWRVYERRGFVTESWAAEPIATMSRPVTGPLSEADAKQRANDLNELAREEDRRTAAAVREDAYEHGFDHEELGRNDA
jgi:hypothetical protein